MKRMLTILCVCAVAMLMTASAQADIITSWTGYFTSDHISGGYGTDGPFGSVVLTQDGADVDFTVTLYDGSKFVRTGAGDYMNFKFNGTDVALGDISGAGLTAATGDFNGDGGGMFHFGVYFTDQGKGGGAGLPGPITFTVVNATIADFTWKNNKEQIFVADVISGIRGKTGLVDVSSGTTGTPVPIPGAILLLGPGLAGLVALKRRIKK
jgi:hypothetical protein